MHEFFIIVWVRQGKKLRHTNLLSLRKGRMPKNTTLKKTYEK